MSSKATESSRPLGPTIKSGRLFDLPFTEQNANIILLPVPWEVTVSTQGGTATAGMNILSASYYTEVYEKNINPAEIASVCMLPTNDYWLRQNRALRPQARRYIEFLSQGGEVEKNTEMAAILQTINTSCEQLRQWVFQTTKKYLAKGKIIGLVGGEHSTCLGYIQALAEVYDSFGILQIDAHQDLIRCYEGFEYSHASISYHTMQLQNISQLVQVGIRDVCQEETELTKNHKKIKVFYDQEIREMLFAGTAFTHIAEQIIAELPQNVYLSFDIDGLSPENCPNTGTPVPGGLHFCEMYFLIKKLVESKRCIVGFDLSEVAGVGNDWDGNVGARILYYLSYWTEKSLWRHFSTNL